MEYHLPIYESIKFNVICENQKSMKIYRNYIIRQTVFTTSLGMLELAKLYEDFYLACITIWEHGRCLIFFERSAFYHVSR